MCFAGVFVCVCVQSAKRTWLHSSRLVGRHFLRAAAAAIARTSSHCVGHTENKPRPGCVVSIASDLHRHKVTLGRAPVLDLSGTSVES